jgi:hypothetical protein
MDGERVYAACQLIRKNPVNHAMALDSGLSFERRRHDIDPEMRLSARTVPGMALVLVGFVFHLEALGRESLGQLLCDEINSSHAAGLMRRRLVGQWYFVAEPSRCIAVKS